MMAQAPVILERVSRVAPLGVRFWDSLTNTTIGAGLIVTAYPPDRPERRIQAIMNRSNVFILYDLPGLQQAEYGSGDANFWKRLSQTRTFVVEVNDLERRFQPFTFAAQLPVEKLFKWLCAPVSSPLEPEDAIPLFSTPVRPVPGGMAVLRAELQDTHTHEPAAWAVVEAHYAGQVLARGLADDHGRLALIMAYPEPPMPPILSSPPSSNYIPLTRQTWTLDLQASYSPILPVPPRPDLCAALTQAPAKLWHALSPPNELGQVALSFGQELVVKSTGRSELLISAAGSPL